VNQTVAPPAEPVAEDEEGPLVLKHADKVRVRHQLYDVGTIVGFASKYLTADQSPAEAVAREFQRGLCQGWKPTAAWIDPSAVLLCDCVDCPTRKAQNEAPLVYDGQVVLIEGMKWKVVGDSPLVWGPAKLVCVEWL
jgi:hypothetical protein